MIGEGGAAGPVRRNERQITWLIDHRDPEIGVVVEVRDSAGSQMFSFECTTDGRPCVNELPQPGELREISAVWKGDLLVMTQRASTPHGEFETKDRLSISACGERLVFDRVVSNERGRRSVREVFHKLGHHPSRLPDAAETGWRT